MSATSLPQRDQNAQTGGEILSAFLTNDALLWGCIAMAFIALVTVGRVASRRRRAGQTSRRVRAEADAMHDFVEILRTEHKAHPHGIWHYDFATGAQRFSPGFIGLLGVEEAQIHSTLQEAGVDLARLARKHFEETEPYEAQFALCSPDGATRKMVLKACNMRNADGNVQRCVAILIETSENDLN